jgi:ABC-type antimicrobial peptide transport system permease subunit
MPLAVLIRRNLAHFWRTHTAVVAGVAVTVAVLAGALLVGDSVRASLRDMVVLRLGETTHVVTNENFYRAQLADDLRAQPAFAFAFSDAAPLIVLEGSLAHEPSGRSASSVQVYGVDERFWRFHQREASSQIVPRGREALLSPALAREFAVTSGDALLLRVQRPSDVPVESLHGRKDRLGRTIRLSVKAILDVQQLGEFSLRPQQGEVRGVFVPLERLQRDLGLDGRVNTILISATEPTTGQSSSSDPLTGTIQKSLGSALTFDDAGLTVRQVPTGAISVESSQILLPDAAVDTVRQVASASQAEARPLFTYLANTIRTGSREIPYSLVTAADEGLLRSLGVREAADSSGSPLLWLNDWAARDLAAKPGDTVTLEYYVWQEGAGLRSERADFTLAGIVPLAPLNADRALAPDFPGIADTESVSDWDPPFPVDLRRIRPRDEDYWDRYRTTPKALIHLADGQRLWSSRYGRLTAIRLLPPPGTDLAAAAEQFSARLRDALDPAAVGFTAVAVRAQGEAASRGAVNFGEYFVYFSFFLVVSAVLLAGLFFRLGIEQRLREVGLLRALGFDERRIASLFLTEGSVLAVLGSLLGLAGAMAYGALMVYGLRTWWVGAIGTTLLELHVSPLSLTLGGAGGIAAALIVIWWTLRDLRRASPVRLLAGGRDLSADSPRRLRVAPAYSIASAVLGLALLGASAAGLTNQAGGFFGAGFLLLLSLLFLQWMWLAAKPKTALAGVGPSALSRLGLRNAGWRPGRSLLCIALIASATFVIVAVDSFRRGSPAAFDPRSGTGGYPLLAESLLPIPYDLNQPAGREALDRTELPGDLQFISFRLRPGEDVSCLNLYQPQKPRLLGVPENFIAANRMSFQSHVADSPAQRENPWTLLDAPAGIETGIPAIVDANSLTYVLHKKVGDEIALPDVFDRATGRPARLRVVAALQDSIFQSEVLISEQHFLRLFAGEPAASGYRVFLIGAPPAQASDVTSRLERELSDYGFDVVSTADRLAAFHRVENTYLSTFQALGGLGLLMGTFGLAAVLLRNVLERRRELALLRAVGYRQADLTLLVLAENALLLLAGLASGVLTALLAIAPALAERGSLPALSFSLLGVVLLVGLAASLLAVAAVARSPLLAALRSE